MRQKSTTLTVIEAALKSTRLNSVQVVMQDQQNSDDESRDVREPPRSSHGPGESPQFQIRDEQRRALTKRRSHSHRSEKRARSRVVSRTRYCPPTGTRHTSKRVVSRTISIATVGDHFTIDRSRENYYLSRAFVATDDRRISSTALATRH